MKTWTIVKFKSDDSVAAVPTTWINNDDCLWPPYTTEKIATAIRTHTLNTCWPTHKCEVFRNATYDNYNTARAKAKKAEITSDLNSENEFPEKRKRIRTRISSSDSSDVDMGLIKTPPKLKRKDKSIIFYGHLILETKLTNPRKILSQTTRTDEVNNNDSEDDPLQFDVNDQPPSQPLSLPGEDVQTRNNVSQSEVSGNNETRCTCCKHHVDYLKEIMRQQHFTRTLLSDLFVEVQKKHECSNTSTPNEMQSVFSEFVMPIRNEEDFLKINDYIKDDNIFVKAVDELYRIGGKDNYEFVKRCLSSLMTNKLASEYSWLGRRDKKEFHTFDIARLIIAAAQKSGRYSSKITEDSIKMWLRRARERFAVELRRREDL